MDCFVALLLAMTGLAPWDGGDQANMLLDLRSNVQPAGAPWTKSSFMRTQYRD